MTKPNFSSIVDSLFDAAQTSISKARDAAKQIDWVDLELKGLHVARDRLTAVIDDEHAYDLFPDGARKAMRDSDQRHLDAINHRITLIETERDRVADATPADDDGSATDRDVPVAGRKVQVRALISADVPVEDVAAATRSGVEAALRAQLPEWVRVAALTVVDKRVARGADSANDALHDADERHGK